MITDTPSAPAALEQAEAILEAEWLRLLCGEEQWDCAPEELLPPRFPSPSRAMTVACIDPSRASASTPGTTGTRARPLHASSVWPTQRSPPAPRRGEE